MVASTRARLKYRQARQLRPRQLVRFQHGLLATMDLGMATMKPQPLRQIPPAISTRRERALARVVIWTTQRSSTIHLVDGNGLPATTEELQLSRLTPQVMST